MGTRYVEILIRYPDPTSELTIRDYMDDQPNTPMIYEGVGYGNLFWRGHNSEYLGNGGTRIALHDRTTREQICGEFGIDDVKIFIDGQDETGNFSDFAALFAAIGDDLFTKNLDTAMIGLLQTISDQLTALSGALGSNATDTLRTTVIP